MRHHCKVAQRQISVRIWARGGGGGGVQKIWKNYRIRSYRGKVGGGGGGGGNSKAYRGGGGGVVNLGVILSGWSPVEIITTSHL